MSTSGSRKSKVAIYTHLLISSWFLFNNFCYNKLNWIELWDLKLCEEKEFLDQHINLCSTKRQEFYFAYISQGFWIDRFVFVQNISNDYCHEKFERDLLFNNSQSRTILKPIFVNSVNYNF